MLLFRVFTLLITILLFITSSITWAEEHESSIKVYFLDSNTSESAKDNLDVIKAEQNSIGLFTEYTYKKSQVISYLLSVKRNRVNYNGKRELNETKNILVIKGLADETTLSMGLKIQLDATSEERSSSLEFRVLNFSINDINADYLPRAVEIFNNTSSSGKGIGYLAEYQHFYNSDIDFILFAQTRDIHFITEAERNDNSSKAFSNQKKNLLLLGGGLKYYFDFNQIRKDNIEVRLNLKREQIEVFEFSNHPTFNFSDKTKSKKNAYTIGLQYRHIFSSYLDVIFSLADTNLTIDNDSQASNFNISSQSSDLSIGVEYYFD